MAVEWEKVPNSDWEEALDGRLLLAKEGGPDERYPWVVVVDDGIARSWRIAGHFAGKSDARHFIAAVDRVLRQADNGESRSGK